MPQNAIRALVATEEIGHQFGILWNFGQIIMALLMTSLSLSILFLI